jgi:hypothetical protein
MRLCKQNLDNFEVIYDKNIRGDNEKNVIINKLINLNNFIN